MSTVCKITCLVRTLYSPRFIKIQTSNSSFKQVHCSRRLFGCVGDVFTSVKNDLVFSNGANRCLHTAYFKPGFETGYGNKRMLKNQMSTPLLRYLLSDFNLFSSKLLLQHFSDIPNKDQIQNEKEADLSVFQRFKRAYKEHGKVLIGVHLATSTVWFGSFYTAAIYGFDIIPFLEQLGASETITKPFKIGGLGDIALAYLMYKVATPARYTVTLGGTNLIIRHFKKTGKIIVSKEDSLRNLYADSKTVVQENREKLNSVRKLRIEQNLKDAREKRNQFRR